MTTENSIKQPLIAGLLARVSTSRQENEATIESQIAEIKTRIEADGNTLPNGNIFLDDGWTGEMLARPGLDAMRDAATSGAFQVLYVYDRGRISRVFAYQEIVIEELTDKGIQFVTLHDVQATTPEEHVLQAMQGVFHEYERVKIAERMRRGKLYKARNGVVINGSAPFGYKYVKKTETTPTHFEVNGEEAEIVRKIFHWIGIDRISIKEVIRRLYNLGVKPRRRKSEFWTNGPILRMLGCETYDKGLIFYNKTEACVAKKPLKHDKYKKIKKGSRKARPREDWIPFKVEPLLTEPGIFDKVQQVLAFNQRHSHSLKAQRFPYLLTGQIYHGCGGRMAGDGSCKENHFYYRCAARTQCRPDGLPKSDCRIPGVNAAVMDGLFWIKLREHLSDPDFIRRQTEEYLVERVRQNEAYNDGKLRLEEQIEKIKEEEGRYAKAYGAGSLEFEQFQGLIKDAKKRKLALGAKIKDLEQRDGHIIIDQSKLGLYCAEMQNVLRELDFSDKRKTVQDIIDKVAVCDGGRVEVSGHLPLFNNKLEYEPISRNYRPG